MTKIDKYENVFNTSAKELLQLKYKKVEILDPKKQKYEAGDLIELDQDNGIIMVAKLEGNPLIGKSLNSETIVIYRK